MVLLVALWNCSPGTSDGDADADTDADGDEAGDVCDLNEVECCDARDCSDGLYCNGVEICDRGVCQMDPDAVCTPALGCAIHCDDDVACTNDSCDEATNRCVHAPVHERCDDGDICTGDERCDPRNDEADEEGCVHGAPWRCNDEDPCTDDYCLEGECRARVRDSDADGHGDHACVVCESDDPDSCERGDDCNDANDQVYPGAEEVCDDGVDNNCDRARDYADTTCTIPNDACSTATELLPGETVHASTRGAVADIDTACGASTGHDVVFSFTMMSAQDVTVSVAGFSSSMTASLTSSCGDPDLEQRCLTGRAFDMMARSLPAGTYYVVITSESEVDFDISLGLAEPVPPLDGDLCTTASEIGLEGGSFSADTEGMWADYDSACGNPTDLDLAYSFTLAEPRSLTLNVVPNAGPLTTAIQPDCGVVGSERSCFSSDMPHERFYRSLDAGRYYLIFKSPAPDTFDFDIAFGVPEPTVIEPWIDNTTHGELPRTGSLDDGQYNLDIAPLSFPFNGESFGCVSISTNGYLRFGAAGACPRATGYSDSDTDIDAVFGSGTAQVSWLGDDGYAGTSVTGFVDTAHSRVVITYLGHRRLSATGLNNVQIILYCDIGDVQLSYTDSTFDTTGHWSIGVSEPGISGGELRPHDFTAHPLGTVVSFDAGAISQDPVHDGATEYLNLNERAIYFQRSGAAWEVLVDELPL